MLAELVAPAVAAAAFAAVLASFVVPPSWPCLDTSYRHKDCKLPSSPPSAAVAELGRGKHHSRKHLNPTDCFAGPMSCCFYRLFYLSMNIDTYINKFTASYQSERALLEDCK